MERVLKEKWNEILEFMKTEYNITDVAYRTWLLPLTVHSVTDNTIIVAVDDSKTGQFSLDFIKNKYGQFLKTAIAEMFNQEFELQFVLSCNAPTKTEPLKTRNESYNNLNSKYTFDSFVIGNNNKFAHEASLSVAESPEEVYNPLFI